MNSKASSSLQERLTKTGIKHFRVLIHDQPKEWLIKNFSQGADEYPTNVARLMRNIIWQTRERIVKGEKPPLNELIRTFWYMYIKSTLTRCDSLTHETDQYNQLVAQLVYMAKEIKVMEYKDIGFRDDNQAHKQVGANANIILFSEKLGHQAFLSEIIEKCKANKYNLIFVEEQFGHSSIKTTRIYASLLNDDTEEALENLYKRRK